MKISKIEHKHYANPIPVYDVVNAGELHNFIIQTDNSNVVSHNCLLQDEVNFSKAGVKDITISKAHMKHIYDTANARITGTFKLNGKIYGKMFTCSSKNTDNDYLSDHIEKQLNSGNTHLYLYDRPQWEVLPAYRFGKEKFYITVGDRYKRGFVVPDENADPEHLKEYEAEGYEVLEVPADYKPNFKADYDIALRDIAGRSVVGSMGFITQEMITPNISETRKNPFFLDYYEIGVQDNQTLEQFFHPEVVPQELKRKPMNIHIDFAEVSDHIGVSGPYVVRLAGEMGGSITQSAARKLVSYTEMNMTRVKNELLKMIALGEITDDLVAAYVEPSYSYRVFDFTDAIARGSYTGAYEVLSSLARNPAEYSPFFTKLTDYIRLMLHTKLAKNVPEADLARALGVSPYPLQKAKRAAANYTPRQLLSILMKMYSLEQDFKSGNIGVENAMDLAIAEAIEARKK